jgi:hypothetical protein
MSSMRRIWTRALRSMISSACARFSPWSRVPSRNISSQPTTTLSGVRSSWDNVARKLS